MYGSRWVFMQELISLSEWSEFWIVKSDFSMISCHVLYSCVSHTCTRLHMYLMTSLFPSTQCLTFASQKHLMSTTEHLMPPNRNALWSFMIAALWVFKPSPPPSAKWLALTVVPFASHQQGCCAYLGMQHVILLHYKTGGQQEQLSHLV